MLEAYECLMTPQIHVPPETLASYSHSLLEAALRVVKRAISEGVPELTVYPTAF